MQITTDNYKLVLADDDTMYLMDSSKDVLVVRQLADDNVQVPRRFLVEVTRTMNDIEDPHGLCIICKSKQ